MTVTELGRRMSSAEFAEWIEYAAREPVGQAQFFTPADPVDPVAAMTAKLMTKLRAAEPRRVRQEPKS